MEISGEDIKFIVMFIVIWGILLSVYEVLSLFEEKLKSMNKCLWQLKNRSLGSLKIQSVYWGLGV